MNSREKILNRIKKNQPALIDYAVNVIKHTVPENSIEKFKSSLQAVGGAVAEIKNVSEAKSNIEIFFPKASLILSGVREISYESKTPENAHALAEIEVAILEGEFGVAENGAVWITEKNMIDRALPFICENLVLVIRKENILPTLHEAYDRINDSQYEYGTFISGPSKTADIEQSLVLGAHGAKALVVFILD
jgi:L-lactate dehydrogenase complex protein LldG